MDLLLDEVHGSWHAVVVRSFFEEEVANFVLKVHVSVVAGMILCPARLPCLESTLFGLHKI
jgi:hypothetical protein